MSGREVVECVMVAVDLILGAFEFATPHVRWRNTADGALGAVRLKAPIFEGIDRPRRNALDLPHLGEQAEQAKLVIEPVERCAAARSRAGLVIDDGEAAVLQYINSELGRASWRARVRQSV